ncbi:hypothetical protein NL676_018767 [Syzygium grande]|nr:hypothetical protein NL676_018767 [Syzygium grande]
MGSRGTHSTGLLPVSLVWNKTHPPISRLRKTLRLSRSQPLVHSLRPRGSHGRRSLILLHVSSDLLSSLSFLDFSVAFIGVRFGLAMAGGRPGRRPDLGDGEVDRQTQVRPLGLPSPPLSLSLSAFVSHLGEPLSRSDGDSPAKDEGFVAARARRPGIKYSLSIVADKGLKKPLYTSARLKKEKCCIWRHIPADTSSVSLEKRWSKLLQLLKCMKLKQRSQNHHSHSMNGERNHTENTVIDVFRWSRCKKPLLQKVMRSVGIPLPPDYLEVLEENLDWEDVQWSQTGAWIAGKEYSFARVHFLSLN